MQKGNFPILFIFIIVFLLDLGLSNMTLASHNFISDAHWVAIHRYKPAAATPEHHQLYYENRQQMLQAYETLGAWGGENAAKFRKIYTRLQLTFQLDPDEPLHNQLKYFMAQAGANEMNSVSSVPAFFYTTHDLSSHPQQTTNPSFQDMAQCKQLHSGRRKNL